MHVQPDSDAAVLLPSCADARLYLIHTNSNIALRMHKTGTNVSISNLRADVACLNCRHVAARTCNLATACFPETSSRSASAQNSAGVVCVSRSSITSAGRSSHHSNQCQVAMKRVCHYAAASLGQKPGPIGPAGSPRASIRHRRAASRCRAASTSLQRQSRTESDVRQPEVASCNDNNE